MQKPLTVLLGAQGRIPHAVRLVTDQSRGILEEATAPIALVLLARFHSWRLFASLFNFRQLFCYISHHDLSFVLLSTIDNNINNCKLKSEKNVTSVHPLQHSIFILGATTRRTNTQEEAQS